jgi:hypothetical protein
MMSKKVVMIDVVSKQAAYLYKNKGKVHFKYTLFFIFSFLLD